MTAAAHAPHPSRYIRQEMRARRWSRDELARRMPGDFGINRLALDFYLEVGPLEPSLRIGTQSAFAMATAFGVPARLFLDLERAWLEQRP